MKKRTFTINGIEVTMDEEMALAYLCKITGDVGSDVSRKSAIVAPEEVVKSKTKPKATVKAQTKTEDKTKHEPCYVVSGLGVAIRKASGGYVPKSVFTAIRMSLKDGGATWDADKKLWMFATKKDLTAWVKAQTKFES